MRYLKIPYVNKNVSRIFCGTATKPYNRGENCNALLSAILSLGINAFDTARVYGGAENALGRWIEECGVREEIVILSKCCHPSLFGFKRVNARAMRADIKKSLCCLNTDYIDIYLLHRDDPSVPVGEIVEELNALHSEGRIGAFGGSNWSHERILQANEYAYGKNLIGFTVSSPDFSLAERYEDIWGGGVSISGAGGKAAREWYGKSGISVIAYSSLARGLFSGKATSADPSSVRSVLDKFAVRGYLNSQNIARLASCEKLAREKGATVAQIALAYVLNQPFPSFAAVSSSDVQKMAMNCKAADITLSKEETECLERGALF